MKPRQSPEMAFENKEWKILARVVKHPTKPGYEVMIEHMDKPSNQPSPYCKTLREAVLKAMDIVGVV